MTTREQVWQLMVDYVNETNKIPTTKVLMQKTNIPYWMFKYAIRLLKRDGYLRNSVDRKGYVLLRHR